MRWMLMAGWLAVLMTPQAWGQDWLPPGVPERVNQASRIRLEFGAGLLEMRRPRVEGNALSGELRIPKEAPRILGIPITREGGWRRSVDTLIPISRVLNLEVQDGTHWKRGMLIGGVGGAAFGVLAVVAVPGLCLFCTPDEIQDVRYAVMKKIVPITAVTAAVGLGFGALGGALFPRWAMVYRRGEIPLPPLRD